MRVGVLTGGGDCPGLNAVIRGVVRKGVQELGHEFVGFRDGWRGPLENDTRRAAVRMPPPEVPQAPAPGAVTEVGKAKPPKGRKKDTA